MKTRNLSEKLMNGSCQKYTDAILSETTQDVLFERQLRMIDFFRLEIKRLNEFDFFDNLNRLFF